MAELPPSFTQEGCTTAQADRQVHSSLVCEEGIALGVGGELAVTQRGAGANMSVDVASGNAFILGDDAAWQGMYHGSNDATENVVITANGSADPRIDIVVMQIRDNVYDGSGFSDTVIMAVPGAPNPVPAPPATPDSALVLAQVAVAAGAVSITDANITPIATPYQLCTGSGVLLDTLVFTANDAFVKADYPSMSYVDTEVQASGGGGGGVGVTADSTGSGGGSGAYCRGIVLVSALAASETITVGAGGAGGGGSASGANGANSSFGSHVVCTGGQGGDSQDGPGDYAGAGGDPGAVSASPTDAVEVFGKHGEDCFMLSTMQHSGSGADSYLGLGGQGMSIQNFVTQDHPGRDGTGYGSGGGGAINVNASGNNTGGNGAGGIVIVRVYA